jgi:hypothetical protein
MLFSGVKEIKYWVDGEPIQTIDGDNGTFTITQDDDGNYVHVEYWAIDYAGNEEIPHNVFWIDMDQTEPVIDLTYEVIEGNPVEGYLLRFTATATDLTSGMERVEFYHNDELQDTVYGVGPTYELDLVCDSWDTVEVWGFDFAGNNDYDDASIRNKATNNMLLLRIFERFPLLQRLLDVWRCVIE